MKITSASNKNDQQIKMAMNATSAATLTFQLLETAERYCKNLNNSELKAFTVELTSIFDQLAKSESGLPSSLAANFLGTLQNISSSTASLAAAAATSPNSTMAKWTLVSTVMITALGLLGAFRKEITDLSTSIKSKVKMSKKLVKWAHDAQLVLAYERNQALPAHKQDPKITKPDEGIRANFYNLLVDGMGADLADPDEIRSLPLTLLDQVAKLPSTGPLKDFKAEMTVISNQAEERRKESRENSKHASQAPPSRSTSPPRPVNAKEYAAILAKATREAGSIVTEATVNELTKALEKLVAKSAATQMASTPGAAGPSTASAGALNPGSALSASRPPMGAAPVRKDTAKPINGKGPATK